MVSVSTYTGFVIFGLVAIAIFSIVFGPFIGLFQEAPQLPEKNALTRSIALGEFSVSRLATSSEMALPNKVLVNGLLFGANELHQSITLSNETQDARLSFDIIRTNMYGPLNIKAGGLTESRKLPKGSYSFDIKSVGSAVIFIQPESSWWRIWAPALYELNNTRVTISAFSPETREFAFSLDKELNDTQSASLVVQFDKNSGMFIAGLNGNTIHNGSAGSIETVRINTSLLRMENVLSLAAANGAQFSGRSTIVINYLG